DMRYNDLIGSLPPSYNSLPHLKSIYYGCNDRMNHKLSENMNISINTDIMGLSTWACGMPTFGMLHVIKISALGACNLGVWHAHCPSKACGMPCLELVFGVHGGGKEREWCVARHAGRVHAIDAHASLGSCFRQLRVGFFKVRKAARDEFQVRGCNFKDSEKIGQPNRGKSDYVRKAQEVEGWQVGGTNL
ncbi:hypothetical protein S245_027655, partial [Arachis hypogaea]